MQNNGYAGNTKPPRKKRLPLKELMIVSYFAAIDRKGFTGFWACQSDVELKKKRECEGNVEEELKTSQKMWYEPDSIFNT